MSNYDSYNSLIDFYHMEKTYYASVLNQIAYNSDLFAQNRLSSLNFSRYSDYVEYSNIINTNLLIRLSEEMDTKCKKYTKFYNCFSFMSSTPDYENSDTSAYGKNAYYLSNFISSKTANYSINDV